MKQRVKNIVESTFFEKFIILIILINCFFIGVETYTTSTLINTIQLFCLIIFTLEVVFRFTASDSFKSYINESWNIFDLSIVIICFIPESLFENATTITTIRVLRVFRVLRLLKFNEEIKLIVSVLAKSMKSLFYNIVFFLIFMYLFSVIGVTLFQLPNKNLDDQQQKALAEYYSQSPNSPINSPDPYGNLSETSFTLFRILTGEDWTDIRYNLLIANKLKLINVSSTIITSYHVIWYVISAFLLLNLLVGAIINNYQILMLENHENKKNEKNENK